MKYKQAIADFKKLLTLEPQNQLVRMQLDSTQKILRKVEFEKVRTRAIFGTRGVRVFNGICRLLRWRKRRVLSHGAMRSLLKVRQPRTLKRTSK